MTSDNPLTIEVPEIDMTDPELIRDPVGVYGRLQERFPVAKLMVPGLAPMWGLLRYASAKAMLGDARFELNAGTFAFKPEVAADLQPYLNTMQEMNGPEHHRLRKLVGPAFSPRRANEFRPRFTRLTESLLDELPGHVEADGTIDLLHHFARPMPMETICEIVGIPDSDRPQWREYGVAVQTGSGPGLLKAIPGIIEGAREAVARRRAEPADDLLSDLIRAQAEDGDRVSDVELVTLVWNIVLAGQTPTNLIANSVAALFEHPEQLAALRADPGLMPGAVEELTRWAGPQLLAFPRETTQDVEVEGVRIGKGERVTSVLVAANRDPRVFDDPHRLDLSRRPAGSASHLGFAHGPHFCLGAAIARVQTEVALAGLLRRFPDLAIAGNPQRSPDPGTWRLMSLAVTL
ncbi:cytochrome P450 [Actinoalloteichus hymeniacidonis]|uniref:Cytochrome P450 n=1 Tax=Actinoalloteichus hymeniacidonis TaxID=340345 RepID=A0AAC9HT80_9PSEU|nr:cytochrome P450 [Actinoalloteichus hymeniacidonis]AOS64676.1 cytochrome P450 [Actinoalloteichus hymeniacidonis]MBB5907249.1 cytochrome P450 [Actinoalloteichus hymeniacidonis]